jgi:hypothetical protein
LKEVKQLFQKTFYLIIVDESALSLSYNPETSGKEVKQLFQKTFYYYQFSIKTKI